MKYTAALVVASAAIASAQFTIDSNGTIICTGNPNGAFCAGDSLSTNIIIRCTNGIGQAGNCNDNTAGYFPFGNTGTSQCWQSTTTSGDAACAKNCIVECGTGKCGESFTLPSCTPIPQSTSTTSTTSATSTSSPTITSSASNNQTTASSSSITVTSTGTSVCTTGGTTTTITFTTTYCPESTLSTSTIHPTKTPSTTPASVITSTYVLPTGTGSYTPPSNITTTKSGSATPVGPSGTTTATPSTYTGGAMTNSAGAGLAVVGLFIAYFL